VPELQIADVALGDLLRVAAGGAEQVGDDRPLELRAKLAGGRNSSRISANCGDLIVGRRAHPWWSTAMCPGSSSAWIVRRETMAQASSLLSRSAVNRAGDLVHGTRAAVGSIRFQLREVDSSSIILGRLGHVPDAALER